MLKSLSLITLLVKLYSLTKQVPVLIRYTSGKKHFEKKPDAFDLALLLKIENNKRAFPNP